ncbi:TM2 domain-containing protein [Winogradskya consettensis]|nr:TM2 domain-containing protein [Actinoplanes consettensis]
MIAPVNQMMMQMQAQSAYDDVKKSAGLAYVIWFFFGVFGGHRFYLGQGGLGAAMFLTLGGFGFWALLDVALIGGAVRAVNARKKAEIFGRAGLPVL